MDFLPTADIAWTAATGIALVMARLLPLVMLAPLPAEWSFGLTLRLAVLLGLMLIVVPLEGSAILTAGARPLWETLPGELIIGGLLASGIAAIVWAVQLAGSLIGSMSGIESVAVFDPTSEGQSGPLSHLVSWLALLLLLASGGHRGIVEGILRSFAVQRLGSPFAHEQVVTQLLALPAEALTCGLQIAAPIIAAVFAAVFLVGLAGRLVPQGPVLAMSLSVQLSVVLIAWLACWGSTASTLTDSMAQLWRKTTQVVPRPSESDVTLTSHRIAAPLTPDEGESSRPQ
jgi:flagellar biosynthetic protein FliR